MKFFSHHTRIAKGFTLLETLTSVAILTLVIIGPLTVIINSSSYARQTKDVMVATYLAEEGIELLQNQYDSLYVFCKKQPSDVLCTTSSSETPGQIAWRLFKDRFGSGGGQSCFLKHEDGSTDNSLGCSYDFIHMIGDITSNPTRYLASASQCSSIAEASTTLPGGSVRHSYVCTGEALHTAGASMSSKYFTRSVTLEWMPTFETNPSMLNHYQDDIRITARVGYKGFNGYMYTTTITRFMHSQP